MLANAGIVLSGVAVMYFQSPLPDLLIGLVTVGLVLHGAWEILESAREARHAVGADESQHSPKETSHV
jgi:Co/Zn/Cd efflux system component